ncbi:MAG TPA: HAD family hydrolase [Solirubrobacteraceae bacterium]|jgi:phosphoglycolate phosphatase-like HAD superfamily hydrolase|nr:HAD family hydrolase [Solirubrobacteraceae bacterium]
MAEAKLILFDVDGTLIDTGGAGARSWAWAFERVFDTKVDIAEHSTAGMTDPAIGRVTFGEVMGRSPTPEELTRLMGAYQAVLPDFVASSPDYRVLDGVRELLDRLSQAGVALGLTTGGLEAVAHVKLGRAGLNRYFLVGGYGSDSEDRVALTRAAIERGERLLGSPLARERVYVVGDTPLDVAAAEGAGAVSVGVASGRYDVAELRAADPDYVLASLAEPFPGE